MIPNPASEASFAPTIVDLLRQRAAYRPHDRAFTFLVDGENEELNITYAELDRKARTVGGWLMDRGMVGKRVLLLYPSGLDFIAAFMGCLYGGAIAVPAYPPRKNRSVERIEAIAADADAAVALTTRDVLDRFDGLKAAAPSLEHLIWKVDSELEPAWADRWERPDIDGDTLAFLQYTSGSTGTPKGVMLSHENLLHNSLRIMQAFEITRSQSGVFWLPSFHDMGLIGGILVTPVGAVDAATEGWHPELVLLSAGFDCLAGDPLGGFTLEIDDITSLTTAVVARAERWCGGRVVSALEGGYAPDRVAQAVVAHLTALQ